VLRKGEIRYSSGTQQTSYGYTGQYSYAADFGLMYYNARWYDSSLGRFAQADTIVPAGVQGYDRYAYVNNSPMAYVDPSGHRPCGDGEPIGCNGKLYKPNSRLGGCGVVGQKRCGGNNPSYGDGLIGPNTHRRHTIYMFDNHPRWTT